MFEVFIDISLELGAAVCRRLPGSFRRKVDSESPVGQALGLVLGVSLLIGIAVIIFNVR